MTRLFFSLKAIALGCLLIVMTPNVSLAQGTHGGNYYTKADVERIIKRVEERSDAFRKVVDRSLDASAINGTNREDNINQQVKELENAIDKLRKDFDRANTWQESLTSRACINGIRRSEHDCQARSLAARRPREE